MLRVFKINLDPNRVFGLDILRALAILFVVIGHGNALLPVKYRTICDYFVFDGVSIFFVLSGFLIGGILIKILEKNNVGRKMLIDFWIRRWFRTLPNYMLTLIVICLLNAIFISNFTISKVYQYFIFSQNFFRRDNSVFFPEAWSLSIEEWFYLIVPIMISFIILVCKATPRKSILSTVAIIILAVTLFRYYRHLTITTNSIYESDLIFRNAIFTRLDSLMYGVIGAYISFYHPKKWVQFRTPLIIAGIVLFLIVRYVFSELWDSNSLYYQVFSFSVTSLATLLLLPFLSTLKKGKGFLYKPITYVSLISYSMYLLNYTIIQKWIIEKIPWTSLTKNDYIILVSNYGLFWFLVISLSILVYKYFEIPMTQLRDKVK